MYHGSPANEGRRQWGATPAAVDGQTLSRICGTLCVSVGQLSEDSASVAGV